MMTPTKLYHSRLDGKFINITEELTIKKILKYRSQPSGSDARVLEVKNEAKSMME